MDDFCTGQKHYRVWEQEKTMPCLQVAEKVGKAEETT